MYPYLFLFEFMVKDFGHLHVYSAGVISTVEKLGNYSVIDYCLWAINLPVLYS